MATASVRSRRRPGRAVEQARRPASRSLATSLMLMAASRPAKIAFTIIGTAGLAALAVAAIGPKRLEKEVLKPLRGAIEPLRGKIEPQAEKLWAEARPLREQIAGLFKSATPDGRDKLVKSFQSWIGHFHAT